MRLVKRLGRQSYRVRGITLLLTIGEHRASILIVDARNLCLA
jgi:hypothetical protein